MALELSAETYECIVCCEAVRRADGVWACETCFRVLHAACVAQWRERGGSGAVRPGDPWRCPGCQTQHTAPPVDRCLCGGVQRPDANPFLTPHSCGRPCGRRRGGGCPHPCEAVCHAGPCGPCPAMEAAVRTCGCGRETFRLRCGAAPTAAQATCGAACDKPLACGVRAHRCRRACHVGPCDACEHPLMQACYCGRHAEWRACGSGARAPRSALLRLADAGSVAPCVEVLAPIDGLSGGPSSESPALSPGRASPRQPLLVGGGGGALPAAAQPLPAGPDSEPEQEASEDGEAAEAEEEEEAEARIPAAFPLQVQLYLLPSPGSASPAAAPPEPGQTEGAGDADGALASLLALLRSDGEEGGSGAPAGASAALAAAAAALQRQQPPRPSPLPGPAAAQASLLPASPSPWLHAAPAPPRPGFGYFSCGDDCGGWLDCGLHRCARPCHAGDCEGCPLLPGRLASCACGRPLGPAAAALASARRTCLDPAPTCGLVCGRTGSRGCGHPCPAPCHDGPCPPCAEPIDVACRCSSVGGGGATTAAAMLPCAQAYRCVAEAGGDLEAALKAHQAAARAGSASPPSPPLTGEGRSAAAAEDVWSLPLPVLLRRLRCRRPCGRKLACGRHKCARLCCPRMHRADAREAGAAAAGALVASTLRARLTGSGGRGAGGGGAAAAAAAAAETGPAAVAAAARAAAEALEDFDVDEAVAGDHPPGQGPGHMCVRPCDRPLGCGRHLDDNVCHAGPCAPCAVTDFLRPLVCFCGAAVRPPPIACGAEPPACGRICALPRACGHPHPSWHTCHDPAATPCPPCAHPVSRQCAGGHEWRAGILCGSGAAAKPFSCDRRCGRPLPCGQHTCTRPCHGGPCATADVCAAAEAAQRAVAAAAAAAADIAVDEARAAARHAAGSASSAVAGPSADAPRSPAEQALWEAARARHAESDEAQRRLRVSCGTTCGRPRLHCAHACAQQCHAGDADCPPVACEQPTALYCACGRLTARVPCAHGGGRGSADPRPGQGGGVDSAFEAALRSRAVPCDELCAGAARARELGEALGIVAPAQAQQQLGGDGIEGSTAAGSWGDATDAPSARPAVGGSRAQAHATPYDAYLVIVGPDARGERMPATIACPYTDSQVRRHWGMWGLRWVPLRMRLPPAPLPLLPQLLFARAHAAVAARVEKAVRSLVLSPDAHAPASSRGGAGVDLPPMPKPQRVFVHTLAALWGLSSVAYGQEPARYIRLAPASAAAAAVAGSATPATSGPDPQSSIGTALAAPWAGGALVLPSLTLAQAVQAHAARLDAMAAAHGSSGGSASSAAAALAAAGLGGVAIGGAVRLRTNIVAAAASKVASFAAAAAAASTSSSSGSSAPKAGPGAAAPAPAPVPGAWPRGGGSAPAPSPAAAPGAAPPGLPEPLARAMDPAARGATLLVYGLRKGTREVDVLDAFEGGTGRASSLSAAAAGGTFRFKRVDDVNALLTFDTPGRAARSLDAFRANVTRGAVSAPFRARLWGIGLGADGSAAPPSSTDASAPAASVTRADAAAAGSWRAASAAAAAAASAPAPPKASSSSSSSGSGSGSGGGWDVVGASGRRGAASAAAVQPARVSRPAARAFGVLGDEEDEEGAGGGGGGAGSPPRRPLREGVPDSWDEA